jgi:hypothetical protein
VASKKETIQASLQVDLDFAKIREQGRQADAIAETAKNKAESIRARAREISREIDSQEAEQNRLERRFQQKIFKQPAKLIGRAGVGALLSEFGSGIEAVEGSGAEFAGNILTRAAMALPAGPVVAVLAALQAVIEEMLRWQFGAGKKLADMEKRLEARDQEFKARTQELVEMLKERDFQEWKAREEFKTDVEIKASALDLQTWRLMGLEG